MDTGAQLLGRYLSELAQVTDEPGKLTRTFLSPAMRRANALVAGWMRAAGLATREDTLCNLIGRLETSSAPRVRTLLIGSHLDTVRDAGRFDGALGVLLPIVALAELRRRKIALPFAVEVLGFSEEEGVRFASAYLGSKGYTGQLRASDLGFADAQDVTIRSALENNNGAPFAPPKPAHRKRDLLGYVEVHIEQGPVLEAKKLALGVVNAIAGQTRAKLVFKGRAGHAGTTPMNLRRDALAGAAEFTLAAESLAKLTPGLVATVGTMSVAPGAANVIPAEATFSLDLRHPRDAARRAALRQLRATATQIAGRRKLTSTWTTTQDNAAVACSPTLAGALTASVRAVQGRSLALPSGAGHDAVVMSALTPVAMLFVRSRSGLSHHPDEYSSPADLGVALDVLIDFIERLARTHSS
ncbi:MAG: allantoate amidohydrolase [Undibacterium sp.]|nr:allantoate amidohydrolase [Opitutaceae bacterium]